MKLFIYAVIALFTLSSAFAQIPNSDFETWNAHTGGFSFPDPWKTTDSISVSLTFQHSATQETNASNVYHGTSAMKLVSWNAGFLIAPGAATTGNLNTNTFQFEGGYADNVRHDILTGYYKYSPVGGDSCTVMVQLTKWNGSATTIVASGSWSTTSTVTSYTQFVVPLVYDPTFVTPDTALIVIMSGPFGTTHVSSTLYVDSLNFSGINDAVKELPSNLLSVKAFPNPASDFLTVETQWKDASKKTIAILDINGRLLHSIPLTDKNQRIDISMLSTGNYIFELMDDKGNLLYTDRFSVNR